MSNDQRRPEEELSQELHERLCAYVLGEVSEEERASLAAELETNAALREEHQRLAATIGLVQSMPELSLAQETREKLAADARPNRPVSAVPPALPSGWSFLRGGRLKLAAAAAVVFVSGSIWIARQQAVVGTAETASSRSVLDEASALSRSPSSNEPQRQLESIGYAKGKASQQLSFADLEVLRSRASLRPRSGRAEPLAFRFRANTRALQELGYVGDVDLEPIEEELKAWLQARGYINCLTDVSLDNIEEVLSLTRIREGETPEDMFFRCWGDHPFRMTRNAPLSTFAVDVDTASYTLARRYIRSGELPPREQVRTEEFVNYFRDPDHEVLDAAGDGPFGVGLELVPSPFSEGPDTYVLRVTVRAKDVDPYERQPLALTFVVDESGSMSGHRSKLVYESLNMLLAELSHGDSVAVVGFNDTARVLAPMSSAANRQPIEDALDGLYTDGGTNIEKGIVRGFRVASQGLTPGAVNRVVLLSDGVGNIGATDQERILERVADLRAGGIYLNTIGVGMGNHHDEFLEQLADNGDGVCHYIDSIDEARKALVEDFVGAFQPVARDVKIQVEFDPERVESWRQLGYENRALADEDFRNDAVDAGEVNAGHQVTALYEVVLPQGISSGPGAVIARVRYKPPFAVDGGRTDRAAEAKAEEALELERVLADRDLHTSFGSTPRGLRTSILAAQFAEFLRLSVHAQGDSYAALMQATGDLARETRDPELAELAELIEETGPRLREVLATRSNEVNRALHELTRSQYELGQVERTEKDAEQAQKLGDDLRREIEKLEAVMRETLAREKSQLNRDEREMLRKLGYTGER